MIRDSYHTVSEYNQVAAPNCDCPCHKKYGERSFCSKCIDRHKTSPHYQVMKKFEGSQQQQQQ